MTKWVTILLLLLAILAFGLSKMRPVPTDPAPSASPQVADKLDTPEAPPEPSEPVVPPSTKVGQTDPKSPNFGPPPGKLSPSPGLSAEPQATPANGKSPRVAAKSDPFSKGGKKPAPVTGTIKASILSASAKGRAQTSFPADQSSIYLTATPEGIKDDVNFVATYRNIMDEDSEFSPPVASSGPARRRSFVFTPPEGGWESGPYQVVIKAESTGQVLGMDRFEILSPDQKIKEEMPAPEYLDLVPDLEAMEAQSSFSSRDKSVLLRVSAQELEPGTNIRTIWSAVEVDRLTAGELIAVSARPAPGPGQDAVFTFEAPPGGFLSGSYKVDVYFDQALAGSQAFFIQPPNKSDE